MTQPSTSLSSGTNMELSADVAALDKPGSAHRRVHTVDDPEAPATDAPGTDEEQDPKSLLKLFSAGFSFFVAGVNDGCLGPLIPYVVRVYGISTAVVSIM